MKKGCCGSMLQWGNIRDSGKRAQSSKVLRYPRPTTVPIINQQKSSLETSCFREAHSAVDNSLKSNDNLTRHACYQNNNTKPIATTTLNPKTKPTTTKSSVKTLEIIWPRENDKTASYFGCVMKRGCKPFARGGRMTKLLSSSWVGNVGSWPIAKSLQQ